MSYSPSRAGAGYNNYKPNITRCQPTISNIWGGCDVTTNETETDYNTDFLPSYKKFSNINIPPSTNYIPPSSISIGGNYNSNQINNNNNFNIPQSPKNISQPLLSGGNNNSYPMNNHGVDKNIIGWIVVERSPNVYCKIPYEGEILPELTEGNNNSYQMNNNNNFNITNNQIEKNNTFSNFNIHPLNQQEIIPYNSYDTPKP